MPKTPVFPLPSPTARIAKDGCLLPTLNLYRHGDPVGMTDFARLAQVAPATARKTLPAMKRHGLVTVRSKKRGAAVVARIALTELGRQVGAALHEIDALIQQGTGNPPL